MYSTPTDLNYIHVRIPLVSANTRPHQQHWLQRERERKRERERGGGAPTLSIKPYSFTDKNIPLSLSKEAEMVCIL